LDEPEDEAEPELEDPALKVYNGSTRPEYVMNAVVELPGPTTLTFSSTHVAWPFAPNAQANESRLPGVEITYPDAPSAKVPVHSFQLVFHKNEVGAAYGCMPVRMD
jgi:hypothetical protein